MLLIEKLVRAIATVTWVKCLTVLSVSSVFWSSAQSQPPSTQWDLIQQIGVQGHWKLGHCCMVRIAVPAQLASQVAAVEITTLDGDGVEVVYRQKVGSPAQTVLEVPVRIGQLKSLVSVCLVDSQLRKIATQDKDLANTVGFSATQPLVLCVGASMGLEDLVRVSADATQRNMAIISIDEARDLPSAWLAYQPYNLLVISTSNSDLLQRIQPQQWQALEQWIRRGGGCIISLGGKAEEIQSIAGLTQLLPGQVLADANIRSPAALESMIITEQQLQPFPAVQLSAERGRMQLGLKDSLSRLVPWWVCMSHGHGSIQVIASDLSHSSFANWKQRKTLWERLVSPYIDKNLLDGSQSDQEASSSYLGYGDLTGQLRASLDQFQGLTTVGFSQVAAVLVCILLLIGPIDYFVSVKWLKRPDLSWPIAGTMLLLSSAGLSWYYTKLRPNQVITNAVQIIDIDTRSGQTDAHLWCHTYSAQARRMAIQANNSMDQSGVFLDWQGLPGKGLGGLQSQLSLASGLPSYSIEVNSDQSTAIQGVGVPAAGTKSLYGTYSRLSEITNNSSLRELNTIDQLEGELVNPLDVDLRDVTLYYHRWYYSLSSRIPAGQRFKLSSQVIPKDVVRRLNKQQEVDGKASAARWNPGERNELDRLLELMMFHNAATGRNYTSLTHNYQSILDHSQLLESDTAILVGRLESSPIRVEVKPLDSADTARIETGIDRAWCRIIIPVETGRKPNR